MKIFKLFVILFVIVINGISQENEFELNIDDSSSLSRINPAPKKPIAQTAIGIGCSITGVSVLGVAVLFYSLASEDFFMSRLFRIYGTIGLLQGLGFGVSGVILLSRAKKKWDIYNKWEIENKVVEIGVRLEF